MNQDTTVTESSSPAFKKFLLLSPFFENYTKLHLKVWQFSLFETIVKDNVILEIKNVIGASTIFPDIALPLSKNKFCSSWHYHKLSPRTRQVWLTLPGQPLNLMCQVMLKRSDQKEKRHKFSSNASLVT